MNRFECMQAFVAVVETGSFTAAAGRLDRTKSAISRQVAALEERLGAQLLNRTTRRLSLTDAGREYHERIQRILADLAEAEASVASDREPLHGRVRLAAPLSFGILHLAPALDEFLLQHPDVMLDMDFDDRRLNLVEEGFDVAVRIGELPDSSLVARALAPIRIQLCASPQYLERHGTPRTPQELGTHTGLLYGNVPEAQQWRLHDAAGHHYGIRPRARVRSNNGDVLMQAALAGLGVAVLPTFLTWRALAGGRLVPLLPDYHSGSTTAYVVYPSRRLLPLRVRRLVEFLAERFGGVPYWDRPQIESETRGTAPPRKPTT